MQRNQAGTKLLQRWKVIIWAAEGELTVVATVLLSSAPCLHGSTGQARCAIRGPDGKSVIDATKGFRSELEAHSTGGPVKGSQLGHWPWQGEC